ncbi:hypothetical protein ABZ801_12930 [Actinomadura sp. NPDC047616]|uniref:hypothetical protein n=1 Tax=Actinomadura sp. NPDC047616 TaxID=3155914 RepID=UPI00340F3A36
MGVLTDYFRAPDAESVVEALEPDGSLFGYGFDRVQTKGVDSCVVLGQLIAAITKVPWSPDLVKETTVWPTTPYPWPEGPEDDDDPWVTGPWVTQLDSSVRDALAGVPDADVPELAAEWMRAEELDVTRVEHIQPLLEKLIELAVLARARGEQLYCWVCL